ncbi:hypothetical protein [Pectinatus frisingensis]|uniref:hypothetical protein n=1 Tax=Pectinatus frisingensis TaxID=865 RepID=UPI003D80242F
MEMLLVSLTRALLDSLATSAAFSTSYNSFNALLASPDSGIILRYCMPSFKTFTALIPSIADNAASAVK